MCVPGCICICDRKYGPFVHLSLLMRSLKWFMIFGDNVSRCGSWQNNVVCFLVLCAVCDGFCRL